MRGSGQRYILLLSLSCCLLLTPALAGTERTSFTVLVTDEAGKGLPAAHVTIVSLAIPMAWPMKFETDEYGEAFVRLKPGEYVLTAKAPDCGASTTHITIHEGINEKYAVSLRRSAAYCGVPSSVRAPMSPILVGQCENWSQD